MPKTGLLALALAAIMAACGFVGNARSTQSCEVKLTSEQEAVLDATRPPTASITGYVAELIPHDSVNQGNNVVGVILVEGSISMMSGHLSDVLDTGFQEVCVKVVRDAAFVDTTEGRAPSATYDSLKTGSIVGIAFAAPVHESGVVSGVATRLAVREGVSVRGRMTLLREPRDPGVNGIRAVIFVEGAVEDDTSTDKANVYVYNGTRVYRRDGEERYRVTLEHLRDGQLVEVVFKGAVAASYPPIGGALEILILE